MRISKVCYERYSTFSKKAHMHENGIRAHCLSWFKRRKWSNNELKNLLDSAQKKMLSITPRVLIMTYAIPKTNK